MHYKKIYDQLVEKCKIRGLDKSVLEGYFEKHHIVPRCMEGTDDDDNLVLFTPREHVIAHRLLWKAYPDNHSLMWAYTRTVNSHKGILTSREVEKAKIAKAELADLQTQKILLSDTLHELKQSALLVSSPEGIAHTSPKSIQLSSGENIIATAQKSAVDVGKQRAT